MRALFFAVLLALLNFAAPANPAFAQTLSAPEVRVDESAQDYRRITLSVDVSPDPAVAAWQVWFAERAFSSSDEARLHSMVRVGDTRGLERPMMGAGYDDCRSDGRPVHRDEAGWPVVGADATRWSCALSGMRPGVETWFAVVPVDAQGRALIDTSRLAPVSGRTTAPDRRTPPADTRPVLLALASTVLSTIVLLGWLRWRDARAGQARSRLAHVYVAPALIALVALTFYPIAYGIGLAFTDASQSHLGDEQWVGLANFAAVFATPGMWRVTGFTFVWAVSNVVAHMVLGLALALALNRRGLRGRTVYRTVLLLPWAIPAYISVLAWNGILQADGLLNAMLGTRVDFLADIDLARIVVIAVNIWLGVPFMMASFSGALQAISRDMYEAAEVDGVSRFDQLVHLTLPSLKSTLVPVSLLGFIWSFNAFSTIYLLSRGGPNVGFGEPGATDILITYVFEVAFTDGLYGLAAAWSVLIFLVLMGFSWLYLKGTRGTEATA